MELLANAPFIKQEAVSIWARKTVGGGWCGVGLTGMMIMFVGTLCRTAQYKYGAQWKVMELCHVQVRYKQVLPSGKTDKT